eukprot:scaffold650941_cov47-Prasinocladus_malaysianus.AAC.1
MAGKGTRCDIDPLSICKYNSFRQSSWRFRLCLRAKLWASIARVFCTAGGIGPGHLPFSSLIWEGFILQLAVSPRAF